jgi:hypothetical protein
MTMSRNPNSQLPPALDKALDEDTRIILNVVDGVLDISANCLKSGHYKRGYHPREKPLLSKYYYFGNDDGRICRSISSQCWREHIFPSLMTKLEREIVLNAVTGVDVIPQPGLRENDTRYKQALYRKVSRNVWFKRWREGVFQFLELPLEIRQHIYDYLLPDQEVPIDAVPQWENDVGLHLVDCHIMSLVLVNRQISDEVQNELYGNRIFRMTLASERRGLTRRGYVNTFSLVFGPQVCMHSGFRRVRKWKITVDNGREWFGQLYSSSRRNVADDDSPGKVLLRLYEQVVKLKDFLKMEEKHLLLLQIDVDNTELIYSLPFTIDYLPLGGPFADSTRLDVVEKDDTGYRIIPGISNLELVLGPLASLNVARVEATIRNNHELEARTVIEKMKRMLEEKDERMSHRAQEEVANYRALKDQEDREWRKRCIEILEELKEKEERRPYHESRRP